MRTRRAAILGFVVLLLLACLLAGFRRADRALLAACPIAYVGEDEQIHLTNETGTLDVELPGPRVEGRIWFSYSPPAWSPSGRRLAYLRSVSDAEKYIVVVEVGTGRHWAHRCDQNGRFAGWGRDDTVLEGHVGFRDAETGAMVRELAREDGFVHHVALASRRMDAAYVAVRPSGEGDEVHLRDEDFRPTRTIFASHMNWVPRLSPGGDWVGWTARRHSSDFQFHAVAIKAAAASPSTPPTYLGQGFGGSIFCDWTADGNILANVAPKSPQPPYVRGPWRLVILDRQGNLLREVPTEVPPLAESVATWRRPVQ